MSTRFPKTKLRMDDINLISRANIRLDNCKRRFFFIKGEVLFTWI